MQNHQSKTSPSDSVPATPHDQFDNARDDRTNSALSSHLQSCRVLFDADFYLSRYPDIAAAGVDPLVHYLEHGWQEGRYPMSPQSVDFDRVCEALSVCPTNRMARQLEIMHLLKSSDFLTVQGAIDSFVSIFGAPPVDDEVRIAFEVAAFKMFERWLRGESLAGIRAVRGSIERIGLLYPSSNLLHALRGLALYQCGELPDAEQVLNSLPTDAFLATNVQEWCSTALRRIDETRRVNARPNPSADLLLLDNSYPSQFSSFRYGELSNYLERFGSSSVCVRPDEGFARFGESKSFQELRQDLFEERGIAPDRVRRFDSQGLVSAKVGYTVFLNQADFFFTQIGLPAAEHLAFTLYPGGGFAPDNPKSDLSLRTLCENDRVKKIITTQIVSYRYLIDGGFCNPERILHLFGAVVPAIFAEKRPKEIKAVNEGPLNICFVAQRYSPIGAEKGYDVFAQIVKIFANSPDINFHVVGGFDESIIDIRPARNITFYGTRPASFFESFYRKMDAILSPNIELSALDPSAPRIFDGFPTTCVMEAGLQAAAMFVTDFQNMNHHLDGTPIFSPDEMTLIDRDAEAIAATLRRYLDDRQALRDLGESGRQAILREYSFECQMRPRLDLLGNFLAA
ncbi:glycosyltransferase family protein [Paraburkholderia azotifigens]|uniref:glycosyltransferase family protein n=1 Tax=Paraburkholderia azotifigens TaxID=2057004 RepID=UPI0038BA310F